MAQKIKGSNIVIYRVTDDGDVPFACMKNGELLFETDEKITNSQTSAFWEDSIPGLTRWSIAGDGLMTLNNQWNYLYLLTDVINREIFNVKLVIDNGTVEGLSIVEGQMFIRNLALSKVYNAVSTYQVQLKGKGQPSISGTVVTPAGTTIIAGTALTVVNVTAIDGQTTFVLGGGIGKNLVYASSGGIGKSPIGSAGIFNTGVTWDSVTGTATIYIPAVADESWLFILQ